MLSRFAVLALLPLLAHTGASDLDAPARAEAAWSFARVVLQEVDGRPVPCTALARDLAPGALCAAGADTPRVDAVAEERLFDLGRRGHVVLRGTPPGMPDVLPARILDLHGSFHVVDDHVVVFYARRDPDGAGLLIAAVRPLPAPMPLSWPARR